MTGYHKHNSWVSSPKMTGLCTTDDYGRVIDACPVWSWSIGQDFTVLVIWLAKVSGSPIEIVSLDKHII